MIKEMMEVLGENGEYWTKYEYHKEGMNERGEVVTRYCLLGAANAIDVGCSLDYVCARLAPFIKTLFPDKVHGSWRTWVVTFNDANSTTWEDVKLVLKHALEDEA